MASTNKTPNFDLPQFLGTDKPSWLGDINPSMLTIDEQLMLNKANSEQAISSAQNAVTVANSATAVAGNANTNAQALSEAVDGWVRYVQANPSPSIFGTYSNVVWVNKKLQLASIYCLATVASGQTSNLVWDSDTGTNIITLPPTVFKSDSSSTLFFSGCYYVSDGSMAYTAIPQFSLRGRNVKLAVEGQPRPSSSKTISSIVISRVFQVGSWLI